VIADMVSVIGTMGTGFLQNDAAWRELPRLPSGDSTVAVLLPALGRRPAGSARPRRRRARPARRLDRAAASSSRTATVQRLHVVTHEARAGALADALAALGELPEVHKRSRPLR
jgi:hypothetical protein